MFYLAFTLFSVFSCGYRPAEMPKRCCVPSCKNEPTNEHQRKSFYKFPLHDHERLRRWLWNMGLEGRLPSRRQYVCHQHFPESSSRVSWGVRYLERHAVPTIFRGSEKCPNADLGEKPSKYRRSNGTLRVPSAELEESTERNKPPTEALHFYDLEVDPAQPEATLLVETHEYPGSLGGYQSDSPGAPCGAVEGWTCVSAEVLVRTVEEAREQPVLGFTDGQELLTADSPPCLNQRPPPRLDPVTPCGADGDEVTQVMASFETIPNVASVSSGGGRPPPDTLLSSALGFQPISSTLPIVSKHLACPPAPPGPGAQETDAGRGDGEEPEVGRGPQRTQLEEHCYSRSSGLGGAGLEAVVRELRQKVEVLRSRHRRQLDQLLGLESTVGRLRQENLLTEERLQLLEKAYLQTSAAVSDAGETAAIVDDDDSGAFLQSPLSDEDE